MFILQVDLRAVKCESYRELRSGKTIGPARRLKYISVACMHRSRRRRDAGDKIRTEKCICTNIGVTGRIAADGIELKKIQNSFVARTIDFHWRAARWRDVY